MARQRPACRNRFSRVIDRGPDSYERTEGEELEDEMLACLPPRSAYGPATFGKRRAGRWPRCPACGGRMEKVRGRDERMCQDCGEEG